jgi:hypothetical protein
MTEPYFLWEIPQPSIVRLAKDDEDEEDDDEFDDDEDEDD